MKQILIVLMVFIGAQGMAQNSGGTITPTGKFQPFNKPAIASGQRSLDGKYKYTDTANFKERAFINLADAKFYVPTNQRTMGLTVFVNNGGTLVNGTITGGSNDEYWWKDGIADGDLILKSTTPFIGGVWQRKGVVLNATLPAEGSNTFEPTLIREANPQILTGLDTVFKMWYSSGWTYSDINYAESVDGVVWTKYSGNPVITSHNRGFVLKNGSTYNMFCVPSGLSQGNQVDRYTSTNGLTWTLTNAAILTKNTSTWNVGGVYNTSVIIDGGVWKLLVDGFTAGMGYSQGYYTSTNGATWTPYAGNPVLTGKSQGASWFTKIGSTFYAWVLGDISGGADILPTDLMRFSSPDMINWTQSPTPSVFTRRTADEGAQNTLGQVADPFYIQVGNAVYMYYAASPNGDDSAARQQIKLAIASMPFSSLVNTNEGDGGNVESGSGSASYSGSNIFGSGATNIPAYSKLIVGGTFGTGTGFTVQSGAKSLLLYNDGTSRKLDAYDYVGDSALSFDIGKFGNKTFYPGSNVFGESTTYIQPWERLTVSKPVGSNGAGMTVRRGALALGLYNDSTNLRMFGFNNATGLPTRFDIGESAGTVRYPGSNLFGEAASDIQLWERVSTGDASIGLGTGIAVHKGRKSLLLYNDSTNLKLSAFNYALSTYTPFFIGDTLSNVTFPGTNIFGTTAIIPLSVKSSAAYTRLTVNNISATPNSGMFYQHNGVNKWQTFASGLSWYLENMGNSTTALSFDSTNNKATFFGPMSFNKNQNSGMTDFSIPNKKYVDSVAALGGGGSSQWTTNGSDIYYNTGNIGIGKTVPTAKIDAEGSSNGVQLIRLRNLNAGTSASAGIAVYNNLNDGGGINVSSSTYNTYGALAPSNLYVYTGIDQTYMVDNAAGIIKWATGGSTETMRLLANGTLKVANLSGTGSRMVVASSTGELSTQAIPSGGGGTIDATIIDGSTNAPTGNAVFDALVLKANQQALIDSMAAMRARDTASTQFDPLYFSNSGNVLQLRYPVSRDTLTISRLVGRSASVTYAITSGAGTAPTVSLNATSPSTDLAGTITITTGASGTFTGGLNSLVSFAGPAYSTPPHVILGAASGPAAALQLYAQPGTTGFFIYSNNNLAASTTYKISYIIAK